jgi:hypothetical protein
MRAKAASAASTGDRLRSWNRATMSLADSIAASSFAMSMSSPLYA